MTSRILVTGVLHHKALAALSDHPEYDLEYLPDCSRPDIEDLIGDCEVLVTRSETAIDRQLLARANQLKLIVRAAVGVGNIDLNAATERGILVVNTPGKNTNSAAELTFGLLLAMTRKITRSCAHMKAGGWDRHQFSGHELRGKRLGLIGLGNVGHRMARFARGFDMEVYAFDPYLAPKMFTRHQVKRMDSIEKMLKRVDILSVHVPLNRETRGMIGAAQLAMLRPGAWVLNCARGGIIDEQALMAALNSGHIRSAGIDTWESEPEPRSDLLGNEQVVCTPHIGASTEEAQAAIGAEVVQQIDKALTGGVVDFPVNMPEMGVIESPLIKPYTILAEKLGSLAAQLIPFQATTFTISYCGDLADIDQGLIRLGLQKGFTARIVDGTVSYVNSERHFHKLGLTLIETHEPVSDAYRSAITVRVQGADGHELILGGIVFDQTYIRICQIDDFHFEAEPSGYFLVVRNNDKPGVIGEIGMILSKEGVNIESFDLGRKSQGGSAMALIKIDSSSGPRLIQALLGVKNVTTVAAVDL